MLVGGKLGEKVVALRASGLTALQQDEKETIK